MTEYRSGYVAFAGRPNVGKSTLLNRVVGQKLAITSRKAQTTRWNLSGIKTTPEYQAVCVDTPGLQELPRGALNRHMNREVRNALAEVDLVVMIAIALKWTAADASVLAILRETDRAVILALNKVDRVGDRRRLLPYINDLPGRETFRAVVPISARTGENVDRLEQAIGRHLPPGGRLFPEDQVTDQSMRFMAAEFIREKLMRKLGAEVPYRLSVTIDQYRESRGSTEIDAIIWVESAGQKGIVIGAGGALLKSVGVEARRDLETAIGGKVNLKTWVKVKKGWSADPKALRVLGYAVDP